MPISLREVFVTFALIGIFVFAGISFIVQTQLDNDVENTILENKVINKTFTDFETDLSEFRTESQTQKDSFESEDPAPGFGSLIIFSIVGVGKTFSGMTLGVYNIFIVLPASILGVPPIVIGVLTTILIISLILLAWRVYRVGG